VTRARFTRHTVGGDPDLRRRIAATDGLRCDAGTPWLPHRP